jgi:uncharacterized damage-inducible protein DinB
MNSATGASTVPIITADELLQHWQGHRRLTRRIIKAFPDDEALFQYSIGGMRPFAVLVMEFLGMAVPIVRGVATGAWTSAETTTPTTRSELLRLWDESTAEMDRLWPSIPPHRFQEVDTAFGKWKMSGYEMILYGIDNEIHHRGQGYVYLRALGVEPPAFYDRS